MSLQWDPKDPGASLDYSTDWSRWLGTDTLASSTWVVPAGLTKVSSVFSSTTATVWLSGGTVGQTYTVTNTITTTAGRVDVRTIKITIRAK